MQEPEGKLRNIRKNVHGAACWCCGSRRFQLVLKRVTEETELGHLFARCIQCHHSREIDDYVGRVLWM
jgi:hypothetical protein